MNKKYLYLSLLISFGYIVAMFLWTFTKKIKPSFLFLVIHIFSYNYNRFIIKNYVINNSLTMEDFKKGHILGIIFSAILILFFIIPITLLIGSFVEKKLIILQEDFSIGLIASLIFIIFLIYFFNIKINLF